MLLVVDLTVPIPLKKLNCINVFSTAITQVLLAWNVADQIGPSHSG